MLSLQDSKDMVNGMNNNGRTPFDIAFENGFFNLAQLIKNVSDNDSCIDDEESFASTDGEDKEIRDRFLDNVSDIDTQSRSLISSNEEEWNDLHWQHDMTHNDHDAIEEGGRESDIINSQLELMKTLQDENFMLKRKVQQSNTEEALHSLELKLEIQNEQLSKANDFIDGDKLDKRTIDELTAIETKLLNTVEKIRRQKEILLERKFSLQEEQSCCVICTEESKTVLLLPCRHLCVCRKCSERSELMNCPLCRTYITEKIGVFA